MDKMIVRSPHCHNFLISVQRRLATNLKVDNHHVLYNQIVHGVSIIVCWVFGSLVVLWVIMMFDCQKRLIIKSVDDGYFDPSLINHANPTESSYPLTRGYDGLRVASCGAICKIVTSYSTDRGDYMFCTLCRFRKASGTINTALLHQLVQQSSNDYPKQTLITALLCFLF